MRVNNVSGGLHDLHKKKMKEHVQSSWSERNEKINHVGQNTFDLECSIYRSCVYVFEIMPGNVREM